MITDTGRAKIAAALAAGSPLVFSYLAVGDGAGPWGATDNALQSERRRVSVERVWEHDTTTVGIEALLTPDSGGYYAREYGLFDSDGDLIFVGEYPETYIPSPAEGYGRTTVIHALVSVDSPESIAVTVDMSVVLVTRADFEAHAHDGGISPTSAPKVNPATHMDWGDLVTVTLDDDASNMFGGEITEWAFAKTGRHFSIAPDFLRARFGVITNMVVPRVGSVVHFTDVALTEYYKIRVGDVELGDGVITLDHDTGNIVTEGDITAETVRADMVVTPLIDADTVAAPMVPIIVRANAMATTPTVTSRTVAVTSITRTAAGRYHIEFAASVADVGHPPVVVAQGVTSAGPRSLRDITWSSGPALGLDTLALEFVDETDTPTDIAELVVTIYRVSTI